MKRAIGSQSVFSFVLFLLLNPFWLGEGVAAAPLVASPAWQAPPFRKNLLESREL